MEQETFFSGWNALARTAIIAALAYPGMLLMVRLSGHRTLAQLNAFDLIVTVALGSTLASVITSQDVALAQGLLAFALLILMQLLISWSATQSSSIEGAINGQPRLLALRGELLRDAMHRSRITVEEIKAVVRSAGLAELGEAEAVILETNGKLSVVRQHPGEQASALASVPRYHQPNGQPGREAGEKRPGLR